MKKLTFSLCCFLLIGSLLCTSCQPPPTTPDTEPDTATDSGSPDGAYTAYVEQPPLQDIGGLSFQNVTPFTAPTDDMSPVLLSNTGVWSTKYMDEQTELVKTPLTDGPTFTVAPYDFGISVQQFTKTADGTIWGTYSKNEIGHLVRFDDNAGSISTECTWPNTYAFIKLQGYNNLLFIYRVYFDENGTNHYVIEKYDTNTKTTTGIAEEAFNQESGGCSISYLSVANDAAYTLLYSEERTYSLLKYDFDGNLIAVYEMPEYTDEFVSIHGGELDIHVFGDYLAVKSLNSHCTVFQLQEGYAKRIYFTDHRIESEKRINERPFLIPVVVDCASDFPYVFFRLDRQLIIYERNSNTFSTIQIADGLYPLFINKNLDIVLNSQTGKYGSDDYHIYYHTANLSKWLTS